MKIKLVKVTVENYRGIDSCTISSLGSMNILVGPNGIGKSSLANAVARFLPALYRWPSLLRDGDFRFHDRASAHPIHLTFDFTLSLSTEEATAVSVQQHEAATPNEGGITLRGVVRIEGQRTESGDSKGMLNEGAPAQCRTTLFLKHNGAELPAPEGLGERVGQLPGAPSTRVMGGINVVQPPDSQPRQYEPIITTQIEPASGRVKVSHGKREKSPARHAATEDRPNISADGLRARLHQDLTSGERAEEVREHHPELVPRMIAAYNHLRGARQFTEMAPGSGSQPMLRTTAGMWVLWSSLSAGERCLFAFAMLKEVVSLGETLLLIIEEPEANIHISLQTHLLRELVRYSNGHQVFISTHSTGFLELAELGAKAARIFLLSPQGDGMEVVDVSSLAPAPVLQQLGMTARSVGHPKFRVLVEGISDAAFFQACLEQLVRPEIRESLPGLVEFVVCGGPNVIKKHAVADSSRAPGLVRDDLVENARAKLNLARPGVSQFVLFDADGDSSSADELHNALQSKLNDPSLTVIRPWYRTLESLYSPELWWAAYPRKQRRIGTLPRVVTDATLRRWETPHAILSHLFEKVPSADTLTKRKAGNGFRVARAVRESDWATENAQNLDGLQQIAEALDGCTTTR